MFANWIPRTIVAVTLASLMAGGTALAQRGERGGGEGGGRGGGGESSARSRGGGGESSARSRGGGEGSSRSMSRGPSRSSGGESRGGESQIRSFRGGERSGQGRSESQSRSFRGGERSDQGRGESQFRSFRGSERQTFGDQGRDAFRTGRSEDRSGDRSRRGFSEQRGQFDQGRREYEARRPSEDQVRRFLDIDQDDRVRQRGGQDGREFRDRADFRFGDSDDGDRDEFRGRFGDRDDRDGDRDRGDFRDRFDDDEDRFRDRDDSRRDDDSFGRGRDGDYDRWRRGDLGDRGRDHRDWSGRWRDGERFRTSHYIRDRWFRDRWDDRDDYPFYAGWWGRHRGGWDFWDRYAHRHNRPHYWWTWVAAPRLASWVTYGWPQHYYWDYGRGEYIYYDDGAIYVNGRWYQPAPVFYERTVELVEQAPDLSAEEAAEKEWMPLGVFAVTREGASEPNVLVQLAVTQDGVIGGTAFIPGTDQSYPIEGIVEKETQRAVWSYRDERDQRVLMETSIFNLTQPEATGLVQRGPNEMRVIQLVRLEQPEGGTSTAMEDELPQPGTR